MKNYSEQLKSPKWQKKRLEIMQRDGFKCVLCMNEDDTLAVHHKKYIKGRDVWDYDNESLITLCEKCHSKTHSKDIQVKELFTDEQIKLLHLIDYHKNDYEEDVYESLLFIVENASKHYNFFLEISQSMNNNVFETGFGIIQNFNMIEDLSIKIHMLKCDLIKNKILPEDK